MGHIEQVKGRHRRSLGPTVTGQAPGRANLIGEHLDYVGGQCLPIALEQGTIATARARPDDRLVIHSRGRSWEGNLDDLRPDKVCGWPAYVAGVLWALGVDTGVEVDIESTVPVAAGLSSSAALECSVALAIDGLLGLGCSRMELAEAAHRAETHMVGAPTGTLDQYVAMFARSGHALLVDYSHGSAEWEHIVFDPEAQGLVLVIVETGVRHDMTDGGYGSRRKECERAAALLALPRLADAASLPVASIRDLPSPLDRRARYVLGEMDRVARIASALRARDWERFGRLLTAGHRSARDDFQISCAEQDIAVEASCAGGALGARMTGGGFGGCAIALVPQEGVRHMKGTVATAFADNGWPSPRFLRARAASAGSVLAGTADRMIR